jgi:hypothetical protein
MNDTKFNEAQTLFEKTKPAPIVTEYEREQQRIRDNYERLRAERLARETDRRDESNLSGIVSAGIA